jgi:hypothetical protein
MQGAKYGRSGEYSRTYTQNMRADLKTRVRAIVVDYLIQHLLEEPKRLGAWRRRAPLVLHLQQLKVQRFGFRQRRTPRCGIPVVAPTTATAAAAATTTATATDDRTRNRRSGSRPAGLVRQHLVRAREVEERLRQGRLPARARRREALLQRRGAVAEKAQFFQDHAEVVQQHWRVPVDAGATATAAAAPATVGQPQPQRHCEGVTRRQSVISRERRHTNTI